MPPLSHKSRPWRSGRHWGGQSWRVNTPLECSTGALCKPNYTRNICRIICVLLTRCTINFTVFIPSPWCLQYVFALGDGKEMEWILGEGYWCFLLGWVVSRRACLDPLLVYPQTIYCFQVDMEIILLKFVHIFV